MRISDWSSDVCSSDLGQHRGGRVVHGPEVAGVASVAAAREARRALQDTHPAPGLRRHDGGAEAGVAAADHQHVKGCLQLSARHVVFRFLRSTILSTSVYNDILQGSNSFLGPLRECGMPASLADQAYQGLLAAIAEGRDGKDGV